MAERNGDALVRVVTGFKPDERLVQELGETLNAKISVYDKILATQKYLAGDISSFSFTGNMLLIDTSFDTGDNFNGFVRYFFYLIIMV